MAARRCGDRGYGRQGRAWESPIGGMYQSFLLRPEVPPAQLPTLSLLVGLAVRRAVAVLVPELEDRVQVKWPNDIVVAEAPASLDEAASAAGRGFRLRGGAFAPLRRGPWWRFPA